MYEEDEFENDVVDTDNVIITYRDWRGDIVELEYEKLFLGVCKGVALAKRGGDADPHVLFYGLTEDDGSWFISDSGYSCVWAEDYLTQMTAALNWIKENCVEDKHNGYCFK